MKIIYNPANKDFKPALEGHMKGAATHLAKLEGFCSGPFMCGDAPQSGDFHVTKQLSPRTLDVPLFRRACAWSRSSLGISLLA